MSELPADRLGYMDWSPSKVKHLKVQTWYRVNGDLSSKHGKTPLICAHGGPGAAHNYLLAMTDLAKDRPVIFYE
jgi:pimeloyl-ACP methyl ester carboxylesterase